MVRRSLKVIIPEPEPEWRKKCFDISNHVYFDRIIMLFIFLNIVAMGCTYKGIPEGGELAINTINNIFLFIFHVEAFIKISGYGWFYFKDGWNKFDFTIIAITDIVIIIG